MAARSLFRGGVNAPSTNYNADLRTFADQLEDCAKYLLGLTSIRDGRRKKIQSAISALISQVLLTNEAYIVEWLAIAATPDARTTSRMDRAAKATPNFLSMESIILTLGMGMMEIVLMFFTEDTARMGAGMYKGIATVLDGVMLFKPMLWPRTLKNLRVFADGNMDECLTLAGEDDDGSGDPADAETHDADADDL